MRKHILKRNRTNPTPETSGVEVRFAAQPNWFTQHGVYMKQQRLMAEGFPMPCNWMMLTITVNPHLFRDELDAYLTIRPTLPRFMKWVAEKLHEWGYFEEARFCVNWLKFEFQQNGWPHWHIFFNQLERVSLEQLEILTKKFKYGRVEYKKCDSRGIYAFKYAFKAPLKKYNRLDMRNAVPEWFRDYYEIEDGKPHSFDRVRFFQRSRNFLENHADWLRSLSKEPDDYKVMVPRAKKTKVSCQFPRPVWMVLDERLRKVQFIARSPMGTYICSKTARLNINFHEFEKALIKKSLTGEVVNTSPHHYFMGEFPIELVSETEKINLTKICQKNKMTPRQARRLQAKSLRKLSTTSGYASRE